MGKAATIKLTQIFIEISYEGTESQVYQKVNDEWTHINNPQFYTFSNNTWTLLSSEEFVDGQQYIVQSI
jgi:hypothetical protein